jgi:hypothetical protein
VERAPAPSSPRLLCRLEFAVVIALSAPVFADEGKNESGKGWHGDYGGRNWRGKHFDERGPIPYGHLPPPGECRNWYDISAVPFVAASKRNANYCRVVALPFGGGWYWATPLARTQTLLSRLCCPFPGCVQVLCGASSNLFAFSGSPLSGFAGFAPFHMAHLLFSGLL